MIHVNPSKVQTRRACNRCHQAKLKCVVRNGRKCNRCKGSNSDCTFNPRSRPQRQNMQPQSPLSNTFDLTEGQLNDWTGVDFDWNFPMDPSHLTSNGFHTDSGADTEFSASASYPTPLCHSNEIRFQSFADGSVNHLGLSTSGTSSSNPSSETTATTSSSVSTSTSLGRDDSEGSLLPTTLSGSTRGDGSRVITNFPSRDGERNEQNDQSVDLAFWANKITPLFLQFTQHLQTIPRVASESIQEENNGGIILRPGASHDPDRTFHLSESLIDVLNGMYSKLPPLEVARNLDGHSPSKYVLLDEASYLLILSTYLRFLEMHDTAFRYLLACLSHKRDSTATQSCFYLPKLILGSFSLTMTSETRPLLYVNLMEAMLARAKPLFRRLASVKTNAEIKDNAECFGDLSPIVEPNLALQAVQTRETAIANLVARAKTLLSRPRSFNS
ncbi:hypothetical protein P154DRAFT_622289 [Amniculicola lignicola CBS 123094]|uniref:Zn(2)-C6 fungal-type domain-containing protein n=1 Tax=Amniculicola lignicola CBS 123094 TaxID=1392246 RepID=A0A6A5WA37_9PLEO|nr:hypothetical protein P154DRAFT_622289 [Amniculicola lignicola CBS 123094]